MLDVGTGVFAAVEPLEFNIRAAREGTALVAAASCRGAPAGEQTLVTTLHGHNHGANPVVIPLDEQAAGVLRLTVYDYAASPPQVVARRLVYRKPSRWLSVRAAQPPQPVAAGGKVSLTLLVGDEAGNPVPATLGISVVDSGEPKGTVPFSGRRFASLPKNRDSPPGRHKRVFLPGRRTGRTGGPPGRFLPLRRQGRDGRDGPLARYAKGASGGRRPAADDRQPDLAGNALRKEPCRVSGDPPTRTGPLGRPLFLRRSGAVAPGDDAGADEGGVGAVSLAADHGRRRLLRPDRAEPHGPWAGQDRAEGCALCGGGRQARRRRRDSAAPAKEAVAKALKTLAASRYVYRRPDGPPGQKGKGRKRSIGIPWPSPAPTAASRSPSICPRGSPPSRCWSRPTATAGWAPAKR